MNQQVHLFSARKKFPARGSFRPKLFTIFEMSPRALENVELMLSCFELAQRTSYQKYRHIYLLIWPKSYVLKTISANIVKLKAYIFIWGKSTGGTCSLESPCWHCEVAPKPGEHSGEGQTCSSACYCFSKWQKTCFVLNSPSWWWGPGILSHFVAPQVFAREQCFTWCAKRGVFVCRLPLPQALFLMSQPLDGINVCVLWLFSITVNVYNNPVDPLCCSRVLPGRCVRVHHGWTVSKMKNMAENKVKNWTEKRKIINIWLKIKKTKIWLIMPNPTDSVELVLGSWFQSYTRHLPCLRDCQSVSGRKWVKWRIRNLGRRRRKLLSPSTYS